MNKLIVLFCSLMLANLSFAQEKEQKSSKGVFEWGVGLFAFQLPDYRGSDQTQNFFWPIPHFSYRSDFVEAEPSFVRGTFYDNGWFAIKLSLLAGLAVDSEDNLAREGMPDLDFTVEAGPLFVFDLWESEDRKHKLTFEVPIRQVVATDLTFVQNAGFFGVPFLNWLARPQKYTFNWRSELSIAGMFATRRNHDYFYSVGPDFVRPGRPEFAARGGYSGTQVTWILSRRFGQFQFVPFIRYDFLEGVAFEDSPLFRKSHYTVLGLNSVYIF